MLKTVKPKVVKGLKDFLRFSFGVLQIDSGTIHKRIKGQE